MMSRVAAPSPAAYAKIRGDAGLTDRSRWLRMTFEGARAGDALTGLCTNDVLALQIGHGLYAAALSPKGKVLADLRIFRQDAERYLVDVPSPAAPGFVDVVRKYVNPRLARYTDVSAVLACIGVAGPHARHVVAHALACSPATFDLLPPYASTTVPFDGASAFVVHVTDYGVDGFDCFVPASNADALRTALIAAGAPVAETGALETLRIEGGRPAWGVDMTDETLTQEALLDTLDAVSYTKGCYTGQEVVARLHFRGHVNKVLRGLALATAPGDNARVLVNDTDVGDVRSRAISPRLGPIAMAMVRREVEPEQSVVVRWENGETTGTLTTLPFP